MTGFLQDLKTQRWDDHRYYHHSRINQSLHLVSAISFLCAYVLLFTNPVVAALAGWLAAMTSRQIGHFFFEPKGYDPVNHATHEHKEAIKVGYNLQRKVVLMGIWAASPIVLYLNPTLFGIFPAHHNTTEYVQHVGQLWLFLAAAGLIFRTVQLFIIKDVQLQDSAALHHQRCPDGSRMDDQNPDGPIPRHQALLHGASLPIARRVL
jgi:hypothetical protein